MSGVSFTNRTRARFRPVVRCLAHTSNARIHNINVWSVIVYTHTHTHTYIYILCLVVHPCYILHSNIVPVGRSTCRWFYNNNNIVNAAAVYYIDSCALHSLLTDEHFPYPMQGCAILDTSMYTVDNKCFWSFMYMRIYIDYRYTPRNDVGIVLTRLQYYYFI
jgi:hypothetical protein